MSKLFRVTVACDLYIVATGPDEAEASAEKLCRTVDPWDLSPDMAREVRSLAEVPEDWRGAIPYGLNSDDERTICGMPELFAP